MKRFLLSLLFPALLPAQGGGAGVIAEGGEVLSLQKDANHRTLSYDYFQYRITRDANGVKTFNFLVYHCLVNGFQYGAGRLFPGSTDTVGGDEEICTADTSAVATSFAPVQEQIADFLFDTSDVPHRVKYGAPSVSTGASLTTQTPVTPPNPYAVFLDGFGSSLIKYDLAALKTLAQMDVPESALGPLAIRPTATPPSNEVWIANGGLQVTVADLGAQKVITNIATPSLPTSALPVGIAFSNSGLTAFEAFSLPSPDSAGNTGGIAIFNAANRSLTSIFLMKFGPTAFLLSPDGLTAYLLDGGGRITYYDVFSGTADLTASTFTPGVNGGYSGGEVFIHPDGTRLFWHLGPFIESFDLTTRKVTAQFNSGLPTTFASSMLLSADGAAISISNGAGAAVVLDTRNGNILSTSQDTGAPLLFVGPMR